ncbi:uncharacterized protein LOC131882549 [Tigriopus californicus]|uniref:uncharacterized protein LOC131882549 n=1 Tax=Tigriopus californicus TaxID=6832 RepID=UPI0027DA2887|nr:uncharacterized protein LOC131882549 [Tigriopus californicus]
MGITLPGLYDLDLSGERRLDRVRPVFCDGEWTTVLKRGQFGNDRYLFDKTWSEYQNGFGDAAGEHWIGLDMLHKMTTDREYELRIQFIDQSDHFRQSFYDIFSIGSPPFYYLNVNGFHSGPDSKTRDALTSMDGNPFSTSDNDQDSEAVNLAQLSRGGGWFGKGYLTNPFGSNFNFRQSDPDVGITWTPHLGNTESMKSMTWSIRPKKLYDIGERMIGYGTGTGLGIGRLKTYNSLVNPGSFNFNQSTAKYFESSATGHLLDVDLLLSCGGFFGSKTCQKFDPRTGIWSDSEAILPKHLWATMHTTLHHQLWIFGGSDFYMSGSLSDAYACSINRCSMVSPFPYGTIQSGAACPLNSQEIMLNIVTQSQNGINHMDVVTSYIYDISQDNYRAISSRPTLRNGLCSCATWISLTGDTYVILIENHLGTNPLVVDRYHVDSDSWDSPPELAFPSSPPFYLINRADGSLLAIGSGDSEHLLRKMNPDMSGWTLLPVGYQDNSIHFAFEWLGHKVENPIVTDITSSSLLFNEEVQSKVNILKYYKRLGINHTFRCPSGMKIEDESGNLHDHLTLGCLSTGWSSNLVPKTCVFDACPMPGTNHLAEGFIVSSWNGEPVSVGQTLNFTCPDGLVVETRPGLSELPLICQDDGSFLTPSPWPNCVTDATCPLLSPTPVNGGVKLFFDGAPFGPCFGNHEPNTFEISPMCPEVELVMTHMGFTSSTRLKSTFELKITPIASTHLYVHIVFSKQLLAADFEILKPNQESDRRLSFSFTGLSVGVSSTHSFSVSHEVTSGKELCVYQVTCGTDSELLGITDPALRNSFDPNVDAVKVGSLIEFTCPNLTAFYFGGVIGPQILNYSCLDSKVWNFPNPVPDCVKTYCDLPPSAPLDTNLLPYRNSSFTKVGEYTPYVCRDGMRLENDPGDDVLNVLCGYDGHYDLPIKWPTCIRELHCPPLASPPALLHGSARILNEGVRFGPCIGGNGILAGDDDCSNMRLQIHEQTPLNATHVRIKMVVKVTSTTRQVVANLTFSRVLKMNNIEVPSHVYVTAGQSDHQLQLLFDMMEPYDIELIEIFFIVEHGPSIGVCVYKVICGNTHKDLVSSRTTEDYTFHPASESLLYGAIVEYSCGSYALFQFNATTLEENLTYKCGSDGNWNLPLTLPPCHQLKCGSIPQPSPEFNLEPYKWDGLPVAFGRALQFRCQRGQKFEHDFNHLYEEATCESTGIWNTPAPDWTPCVTTKHCNNYPTPPENITIKQKSTGQAFGQICLGSRNVSLGEPLPGSEACLSPLIRKVSQVRTTDMRGKNMSISGYTLTFDPSIGTHINGLLAFSYPVSISNVEFSCGIQSNLSITTSNTILSLTCDFHVDGRDNTVILTIKHPVDEPEPCVDYFVCRPCESTTQCEVDAQDLDLKEHFDPYKFGSILSYQCPPGFGFAVNSSHAIQEQDITCQWNKTWSKLSFSLQCKPFGCPPARVFHWSKRIQLLNPLPEGHLAPFDYRARYECQNGYNFDHEHSFPGFDITCQRNGTWSHYETDWYCDLPSTRFRNVPPPPPPSEGYYVNWNISMLAKTAYGTIIEYKCNPNRAFEIDSGMFVHVFQLTALWNKTWYPSEVPNCVLVNCVDPPLIRNMMRLWNYGPVAFHQQIEYVCQPGFYFESSRERYSTFIKCLPSGYYDARNFEMCFDTAYCTLDEPVEKPLRGFRNWNNNIFYKSKITYNCGPHATFVYGDGRQAQRITSQCQWNRTWSIQKLPDCQYTHCNVVHEPPLDSGFVFNHQEIELLTDLNDFQRKSPLVFPGTRKFGTSHSFHFEGILTEISHNYSLKFVDNLFDVVLDMALNPADNSVLLTNRFMHDYQNESIVMEQGDPIIIRINANLDITAFEIQINDNTEFDFCLQVGITTMQISEVRVDGGFDVQYIGFVKKGVNPAIPVGSSLYFDCEPGKVLSHNWLIKPQVQLYCRSSGVFSEPNPWPKCVSIKEAYAIWLESTDEFQRLGLSGYDYISGPAFPDNELASRHNATLKYGLEEISQTLAWNDAWLLGWNGVWNATWINDLFSEWNDRLDRSLQAFDFLGEYRCGLPWAIEHHGPTTLVLKNCHENRGNKCALLPILQTIYSSIVKH